MHGSDVSKFKKNHFGVGNNNNLNVKEQVSFHFFDIFQLHDFF